jgi:hypothetical protein
MFIAWKYWEIPTKTAVQDATKEAAEAQSAAAQAAAKQAAAEQAAASARPTFALRWGRPVWLPPYIAWTVVGLIVVALLLWLFSAQLAALVTSILPSGGSAGLKAGENHLLPERFAVLVTPEAVTMIVALIAVLVIVAIAHQLGGKWAAVFAAIVAVGVLALAFPAALHDASALAVDAWNASSPYAVVAAKVALTAAVLLIAFWLLKGATSLKDFGDMAAVFAVVIFGVIAGYYLIWKGDEPNRYAKAAQAAHSVPVAARVFAPNTSADCPGRLMVAHLDRIRRVINPNNCYMSWKVDAGRVILSGYMGTKEIGPEPSGFDARLFENAQAKYGTAIMRYVLCTGRKQDFSRNDCS